ncbi:MAG TPA: GNAT family N-acetyltransferase [Rhizomicrobium sp.]|nr:GNAT family N-acetyltransferase [Rhizomicrobium sp.]
MAGIEIRRARPGEENVVFSLLRELAEYEKLLDVFKITPEIVVRDYLCDQPLLYCDLLLDGGTAAGMASWYWTYSSFAARRSIYLEDLFVRPDFRGRGHGKALLVHLARTAVAAGAQRVGWDVLDWNKPSIEFYDSLGARPHGGWIAYRLEGEALAKLGGA